MEKQNYYIVSFSGGKDSTAMLLRLLELGEQVDEIIFCDTYKEFPQMYQHIEKVKKYIEKHDVKFTTVKNEKNFDYLMFEYEPKHKDPEDFFKKYGDVKGQSWSSAKVRWCTKDLKTRVVERYIRELKQKYNVFQYIGLAADEVKRLERKNNQDKSHIHPLVNWGWSEADCLGYCYSLGFDWGGLYEIFDRVSCWCCPLQSLEDLRKLRKHFPQMWEELIDMDRRTWRKFKPDYTVEELDKRFKFEEQRLAEGKSIRSREFFTELRAVLNGTD